MTTKAPKSTSPTKEAQKAQPEKTTTTQRPSSDLEKAVRQAFTEVTNSGDNKTLFKDVQVHSVQDLELPIKGKTRKAAVVVIPFNSLKALAKGGQKKLIPELEKKLKMPVVITAKRTIQSKFLKAHKSQMRPRSRTLTSVHEAILEDLIAPGTIIAKRTRIRVDGSRTIKITLDIGDRDFLEDKVEIIQAIYKKLTTKDISIDFKTDPVYYTFRK